MLILVSVSISSISSWENSCGAASGEGAAAFESEGGAGELVREPTGNSGSLEAVSVSAAGIPVGVGDVSGTVAGPVSVGNTM